MKLVFPALFPQKITKDTKKYLKSQIDYMR